MRKCSCNGENENCYRCSGKGYYNPEEDSFTRVPKVSTIFRGETRSAKASVKRSGKVADIVEPASKKNPSDSKKKKKKKSAIDHLKPTKPSDKRKQCPHCGRMKAGLSDHIKAMHKDAFEAANDASTRNSFTKPSKSKAENQPGPKPKRSSRSDIRKRLRNNQSMLTSCGTASVGWLVPKATHPRTKGVRNFEVKQLDGHSSDQSPQQQWQLEKNSRECEASEITQSLIRRDVFGKFSSGEEPEMPRFNFED